MPNFDDDKTLKCSFCGKPQGRVRKLIAGPGVYICDECIGVCTSILEDELDFDTNFSSTDNEEDSDRLEERFKSMTFERTEVQ